MSSTYGNLSNTSPEVMQENDSLESAPARKKRIPKACGSCRGSKVKCDGLRPCSRCRSLRKICEFVERPRDPYESKIEALEKEIESLKAQLNTPSNSIPSPSSWPGMPPGDVGVDFRRQRSGSEAGSLAEAVPFGAPATIAPSYFQKRNRAHFEAGTPPTTPDLDPISAGLITPEAAESYFNTFFSGCDRYVPVFDPSHDTFGSVRLRSTLLFSAICSVGCRVLTGSESHQTRALGIHAQRMLNSSIAAPPGHGVGTQASLETVQALLVRACYAPERSLLVAVATRMALEIGLPGAYGVLSARCVTSSNSKLGMSSLAGATASSPGEPGEEGGATLMRKTRTWLHLLMMGQILHVDAGGPPSFRFRGAAQRCRILLDSPSSTGIDPYLFSQVELNTLRARIHSTFSSYVRNHAPGDRDDEEIMEMVGDAKIDLNVWFDDWTRIYEKHTSQMPWLTPNLAVQRCWADSMAMCLALKAAGFENVNAMSASQKAILAMAKRSLQQHLDTVLEEPRLYLRSIRYAMDFVWAKNAFCYLLLLKLSTLLPDEDAGSVSRTNADLINKGRELLHELSKATVGVNNRDGARGSSSSGLYLHLIRVSIEKFRSITRSGSGGQGGPQSVELQAQNPNTSSYDAGAPGRQAAENGDEGGWSANENQTELVSFVPEQFVAEWDFPWLTFISSPTQETDWLDDLLAGAIGGTDNLNLYNMGWAPMDFNFS